MATEIAAKLPRRLQYTAHSQHHSSLTCNHAGPCAAVASCQLRKSRRACYASCLCDCTYASGRSAPKTNLPPPCACTGECDQQCGCRAMASYCVPGYCGCSSARCGNLGIERGPKLSVKESNIPGAGHGLFAEETISAQTRLGTLRGELALQRAATEQPRSHQNMTLASRWHARPTKAIPSS